jgi:hypothetical protein
MQTNIKMMLLTLYQQLSPGFRYNFPLQCRGSRATQMPPPHQTFPIIEDHVWFEDRWMVASWRDE